MAFFTQCVVLQRFIQVGMHINSLFLFIPEWYFIVWMYHNLFNQLPVKGLWSFWFRAIMNKAEHLWIDFHVKISFHFSVINTQDYNCWFLWKLHIYCFFFFFKETNSLFFKTAVPFYNPTNNILVIQPLHSHCHLVSSLFLF